MGRYIVYMPTLMDSLRKEEDKLGLEQENTHDEYMEMKTVFEKKI